jgi:hypothetical protein
MLHGEFDRPPPPPHLRGGNRMTVQPAAGVNNLANITNYFENSMPGKIKFRNGLFFYIFGENGGNIFARGSQWFYCVEFCKVRKIGKKYSAKFRRENSIFFASLKFILVHISQPMEFYHRKKEAKNNNG